jgi:hypothetical protein
MQGDSILDIDSTIGEPMRRKASGLYVNDEGIRYASKLEPTKVAGRDVYSPIQWTNSH